MSRLDKARKITAQHITQPIVSLIARTPLTPNALTWLGFAITIVAAVLAATGHLFAAGWVVLVAGLFDMLDGALARATGRITRFGGILDSSLDRVSDAVLLLGILVIYVRGQMVAESLLIGFAMLGSLMVSYTRARMEGAGIECRAGLFTRPERVIVLALGLLLSRFNYALITALAIITFFSFVTAGQRLLYAWKETRR